MTKIVMINGQNHKGSTYHIGKELADSVGGEVTEFFLPRDFSDFCVGCTQCFMKGAEKCPHYDRLHKITEAMDEADILIFTSPVYVYHCTGAMKNFLDHYGWRWIIHRPEEKMFRKQAVCIATAAGAGTKSTLKDMTDSMLFWGVGRVYTLGYAIHSTSYSRIDEKLKTKISTDVQKLSKSIQSRVGRVTPRLKVKMLFRLMRMILKKHPFNETDREYWTEKGWYAENRPWKK